MSLTPSAAGVRLPPLQVNSRAQNSSKRSRSSQSSTTTTSSSSSSSSSTTMTTTSSHMSPTSSPNPKRTKDQLFITQSRLNHWTNRHNLYLLHRDHLNEYNGLKCALGAAGTAYIFNEARSDPSSKPLTTWHQGSNGVDGLIYVNPQAFVWVC